MKPAADARTISLMAVMTAIVFVFTRFIQIPVGTGYFNFSDVGIYFAAFAFGPWVALVAGGLGASLADVSSGYANFAPLTFLAHGLEGFVAGYVMFRMKAAPTRYVVAWVLGSIVMIAIYFIGESAFDVFGGYPQALLDFPGNILQNVGGGILGFALLYAVRRAYPQIDRFAAGA
jgi:energy-coupling factor transport system substrate-specific component